MIEFYCQHCGKKIRVGEHAAGKTGTCNGCGESLVVPSPRSQSGAPPLATPIVQAGPARPASAVSPQGIAAGINIFMPSFGYLVQGRFKEFLRYWLLIAAVYVAGYLGLLLLLSIGSKLSSDVALIAGVVGAAVGGAIFFAAWILSTLDVAYFDPTTQSSQYSLRKYLTTFSLMPKIK